MAVARLEAHIAAVRASQTPTPLASPREPAVAFADLPRPGCVALPSEAPSAMPTPSRMADDPLAKLEAFFASLGDRPPSAASAMPELVRPPPPDAKAVDRYYDEIVQATVRRAWDRAWGAYQNGHASCQARLDGTAPSGTGIDVAAEPIGASAPSGGALGLPSPHSSGMHASRTAASPPSASPWVGTSRAAHSSGSPRALATPATRHASSSVYGSSSNIAHPHKVASNKRPPTTYAKKYQADMRRQ